MSIFKKATRDQLKLRMALAGPSGSGKTFSAMTIAKRFGKVAVIDTEHRSASRYADLFEFDVDEFEPPFHPDRLIRHINAAEEAGYDVVVVDSLSHFWAGKGGILEIVDEVTAKSRSKNSYNAWNDGTAIFNDMVDKIIRCKIHIICTMRSKSEYLQTEDDKGRKKIEKVGTKPIQRDGLEYEFDLVYDMDLQHKAIVCKSRVFGAPDVVRLPGVELAELLYNWTQTGSPPAPSQPAKTPEEDRHARTLARLRELFGKVYGKDAKAFSETFGVEAKDLPSLSLEELEAIGRGLAALSEKRLQPAPPADPEPVTTPAKAEPLFKDANPEKYASMKAKLFAVAGEVWPDDVKSEKTYAFFAEHSLLAGHPTQARRSVSLSTERQLSDAIKAVEKKHTTKAALTGVKN
jgi:hypothetical protein